MQHVGESIAQVNSRMNIHQKGKSGYEHLINHYKIVYIDASFSIQTL